MWRGGEASAFQPPALGSSLAVHHVVEGQLSLCLPVPTAGQQHSGAARCGGAVSAFQFPASGSSMAAWCALKGQWTCWAEDAKGTVRVEGLGFYPEP